MKRIKYLDGFRGIAVLMVLLFHFGIFKQGFVGVELFFVLSGYIITHFLIIEQGESHNINLLSFFRRRISRIYSPMIVMLGVVIFVFTNLPVIPIINRVHQELFYTSISAVNWYEIAHNSGYWESGTKSPLLHMWSIAIEMQFYLVYPFYVYLVFNIQRLKNNFREKYIRSTIILTTFLVLATFYCSFHFDFNSLYYSTFSRISSFLIGGIFAALSSKYKEPSSKKLLILSYMVVCVLILETFCFKLNDMKLFRGMFLSYTLLIGFLMFYFSITNRKHLFKWILEQPPLTYLGKISYSLYLWHIPVIVFVTQANIQTILGITISNTLVLMGLQLILSITLAIVSNKLFEQLIKFKTSKIAFSVVIILPLLMILGTSAPALTKMRIVSSQPEIAEKWVGTNPIIEKGKTPLLIVGDSWSRRIAFGINQAQKDSNSNEYKLLVYGVGNGSIMDPEYLISADGQSLPAFKSFQGYLNYWQDAIDKYHPKKALLIFGFADQATMVVNGVKIRIPSEEFEERYFVQFSKLIHFFQDQGIQIYMTNTANNSHSVADRSLNKYSDAMNNLFEKALNQHPDANIKVLDIRSLLSNGVKESSPSTINSIVMYDYTNHPSYYGAEYIGKYILEEMDQ